jgi:hypothetical protein
MQNPGAAAAGRVTRYNPTSIWEMDMGYGTSHCHSRYRYGISCHSGDRVVVVVVVVVVIIVFCTVIITNRFAVVDAPQVTSLKQ